AWVGRRWLAPGHFLFGTAYGYSFDCFDSFSNGLHQRDARLLGAGSSGCGGMLGVDLIGLLPNGCRVTVSALFGRQGKGMQGSAGSAKQAPHAPFDEQA